MSKNIVTNEQAEQVLQAVKDKWPMYVVPFSDGPTLYPHDHEEMPKGCWSIAWEGGPEDWSWRTSMEITVPGVFLEPMNSWCLGLFPRESR